MQIGTLFTDSSLRDSVDASGSDFGSGFDSGFGSGSFPSSGSELLQSVSEVDDTVVTEDMLIVCQPLESVNNHVVTEEMNLTSLLDLLDSVATVEGSALANKGTLMAVLASLLVVYILASREHL